jgi:hypothetical protein
MRKLLALCIVLAAAGCQQQPNVTVPTTGELMKNPPLLAEWKAKCETGEYSHLPADQKDNFCFTTREAGRSVAIKKMNGL